MPAFFQYADGLLHIAGFMQLALGEPAVEADAVAQQMLLHERDVEGQAEGDKGGAALPGGHVHILVPVPLINPARHAADVVAVVAVFRKRHGVFPQRDLQIARLDAFSEEFHLVAGVVDIELAPDVAAGPVQHGSQGVAQYAPAGVADGHGARGIGGDELHHDLLAGPPIGPAVVGSLPLDVHEQFLIPAVREPEIQKAGTGSLGGAKEAAFQRKVADERLRDFARRHAQGLRAVHRVVGRVVAVFRVTGDLHAAFEFCTRGQLAARRRALIGLLQQDVDLFLCLINQIRHAPPPFPLSRTWIRNLLRPTTVWSKSIT